MGGSSRGKQAKNISTRGNMMRSAVLLRSQRIGGFGKYIGVRLLRAAVPMAGVLLLAAFAVAQAAQVEVKMTDNPPRFVPEKVTINAGDTVNWDNNAQNLHTVTADPAKAADKNSVSLPAGAQPFDSSFMPPGAKFKYTFTVPGTYKYFCIPHEKDGMVGYVVVKKK